MCYFSSTSIFDLFVLIYFFTILLNLHLFYVINFFLLCFSPFRSIPFTQFIFLIFLSCTSFYLIVVRDPNVALDLLHYQIISRNILCFKMLAVLTTFHCYQVTRQGKLFLENLILFNEMTKLQSIEQLQFQSRLSLFANANDQFKTKLEKSVSVPNEFLRKKKTKTKTNNKNINIIKNIGGIS